MPGGQISQLCGTKPAHLPRDQGIAALADRQHGVVSLAQLGQLGLTSGAARRRAASGRLHRVHYGVYAVGRQGLTVEGMWMAAVLACGNGAVLSHRSAAALWGLRTTSSVAVHLIAPGRRGRSRPGIRVHRSDTLIAEDATERLGIPCTTVARTLVDLASAVARRELERALERAEVLRLLDARAVDAAADRAGPRRGVTTLRSILGGHAPELAWTRSELERRFIGLCSKAGLPRSSVNAWVPLDDGGFEVDFLWSEARLIVEVDGHATHGTRFAFERDRLRDRQLLLAGYRVLRFTWRQLASDSAGVTRTIRTLLLQAGQIS